MPVTPSRTGQSLVEVVIATSLLALAIAGSSILIGKPQEAAKTAREYSSATALAAEGMEATRAIIAGQSFALLAAGTYGISSVGGVYSFAGTSDVTDGRYTRSVVLTADSAGFPSGSWLATVHVDWTDGATSRTVQLVSVFTNWRP